ncbi:MAG TPA: helix-turn-helix domain-containing protein [Nocardioides sp.]|nr:helix-turn-helix domain-containing protein [Nocardioides sp.]
MATTATTQESRLLELLAAGASAADIAAVDTDPVLRDLALQVRAVTDLRRRREQELEALVETAQDLATLDDPALVLEAIVLRARTLLGTDLSYLTLHDATAGDTFMRATAGSVSSAFQQVRLELGAGLGGLVASTHRPYWTADYFADDRFRHTSPIDTAVGDEGIVAICGTPLLVKDEFVGVLFAASRSPRTFTADEVALLGSLAALAAVSLVQVGALDTVRRHTEGLERAAAAHDRFAGIVLRGGGVGEITEALHSLLGVWVVLVDDEGLERSAAGPVPETPGEAVLSAAAASRRHPYAVDAPLDTAGRLIRTGDRWVVPVSAIDLPLGQLVVGGPADLDEADRRTVERAAVVTALVLLGERQRADAQLQVRTDLVADLLFGRADLRAVVDASRTMGVDLRSPCCLLVATAPDAATSRRSLVMSVTAALGGAALVAEHRGEVVAVVQHDDPSAAAVGLAQRMSASSRLTVGGSGPVSGPRAFPEAYREARRTASALAALGRTGCGGSAADLGFAGLIVGSDPEVRDFVRSVLGPLLDYDTQRGADLVRTAEAYFQAGSSPRHAATTLHVHVNTVAQRLHRIGELLGADWQEPGRALQIQLALHLRHLTG